MKTYTAVAFVLGVSMVAFAGAGCASQDPSAAAAAQAVKRAAPEEYLHAITAVALQAALTEQVKERGQALARIVPVAFAQWESSRRGSRAERSALRTMKIVAPARFRAWEESQLNRLESVDLTDEAMADLADAAPDEFLVWAKSLRQ